MEKFFSDCELNDHSSTWISPILFTDVDQFLRIPVSLLIERVMVARLALVAPMIPSLMTAGMRTMVKAQSFSWENGPFMFQDGGCKLKIQTHVHSIGRSTFSFAYQVHVILSNQKIVPLGLGLAVVVVISSEHLKSVEIPLAFRNKLRISPDLQPCREYSTQRLQRDLSFDLSPPPPVAVSTTTTTATTITTTAPFLCHRLLLRQSDHDWNSHVNNANYVRFFEDALIAIKSQQARPLEAEIAACDIQSFAIDHVRESRASEECEVWAAGLVDQSTLLLEMRRSKDGAVISRAKVQTGREGNSIAAAVSAQSKL
jgi:acyl-CoA thioesterase FadM